MYTLRVRTGETETILSVNAGEVIADALKRGGFSVDAPCGGRGTCGKCRVLASGRLSSRTERENALLPDGGANEARLACQARIAGDCEVWLHTETNSLAADCARDALLPKKPPFQTCGAAIDVGTTTLDIQIYDANGFLCGAMARSVQRAFGADVISRIDAAMNGDGKALSEAIIKQLDAMLAALMQQAGRKKSDLNALVITGNTSMLYLLTGREPSSLSRAPFAADLLFGETISARALGFGFDADVYLPRCISAFVGADITCAAQYAKLWETTPQRSHTADTALLVDVGTNSEMVLWKNGTAYVCSAAAGPAFEGALLSCGSLGIDGAIDHVRAENGSLVCSVIGGGRAKSVCGSGVVDALSALLMLGWVDETGRIVASHANEAGALLLQDDVVLTQADIRALQLAKAAIRAGIETLLAETGTAEADVSRFYIAGGFGAHLSLSAAVGVGLFPKELTLRAETLGNAALLGASELLLDADRIAASEAFAKRAMHIPLAGNNGFMERYVDHMGFETGNR